MVGHKGTKRLKTARLVLRRFKKDDASSIYNNWASDPWVTRHLSWKTHSDINVSKTILKMWLDNYDEPEFYQWAIDFENNIVGSISLINIDNINENCEIGYCIGRDCWNKGVVTEATSEVIRYAFEEVGFQRITGRHHIDNPASGRVMEKCGMQYEGILRKIIKNNKGELVDAKYYSILKEEYKSTKK